MEPPVIVAVPRDETEEVRPESVAEPLAILTVPREEIVEVRPETVTDPPVIATALAACVAIVPRPRVVRCAATSASSSRSRPAEVRVVVA